MTEGAPPARARSIASDSLLTFAFKILLYVVGFAASVLIARVLGPEGRGAYYLPVVAAATAVVICGFGLEQANVFLFGSRREPLERLWGQAGLVSAVAGALGVAGVVTAPWWLPAVFGATPVPFLWLAAFTVPFQLHTLYSAGLLTLRGDVGWQFRVGLAAAIVQFVLLGTLAVATRLDVRSVLAVNLLNAALVWALMVWPLRRSAWVRWDRALLARTLSQALPLHAGAVLLFLHLRLDMFMVSSWLGPARLGHYSLSVMLAETIQMATDSLSIAVLPRQVGNTLAESAALALRAARANALIGGGLAVGWAAIGWLLIPLVFGRDFGAAYRPLLVLLPGLVLLGMQRACGGPVLRTGHPWRLAGVHAITLAANAGLNALLIPPLGISGAALASSVSYAVGSFVFLRWTAGLAGTPRLREVVPGPEDVRRLWTAASSVRGQRAGPR